MKDTGYQRYGIVFKNNRKDNIKPERKHDGTTTKWFHI